MSKKISATVENELLRLQDCNSILRALGIMNKADLEHELRLYKKYKGNKYPAALRKRKANIAKLLEKCGKGKSFTAHGFEYDPFTGFGKYVQEPEDMDTEPVWPEDDPEPMDIEDDETREKIHLERLQRDDLLRRLESNKMENQRKLIQMDQIRKDKQHVLMQEELAERLDQKIKKFDVVRDSNLIGLEFGGDLTEQRKGRLDEFRRICTGQEVKICEQYRDQVGQVAYITMLDQTTTELIGVLAACRYDEERIFIINDLCGEFSSAKDVQRTNTLLVLRLKSVAREEHIGRIGVFIDPEHNQHRAALDFYINMWFGTPTKGEGAFHKKLFLTYRQNIQINTGKVKSDAELILREIKPQFTKVQQRAWGSGYRIFLLPQETLTDATLKYLRNAHKKCTKNTPFVPCREGDQNWVIYEKQTDKDKKAPEIMGMLQFCSTRDEYFIYNLCAHDKNVETMKMLLQHTKEIASDNHVKKISILVSSDLAKDNAIVALLDEEFGYPDRKGDYVKLSWARGRNLTRSNRQDVHESLKDYDLADDLISPNQKFVCLDYKDNMPMKIKKEISGLCEDVSQTVECENSRTHLILFYDGKQLQGILFYCERKDRGKNWYVIHDSCCKTSKILFYLLQKLEDISHKKKLDGIESSVDAFDKHRVSQLTQHIAAGFYPEVKEGYQSPRGKMALLLVWTGNPTAHKKGMKLGCEILEKLIPLDRVQSRVKARLDKSEEVREFKDKELKNNPNLWAEINKIRSNCYGATPYCGDGETLQRPWIIAFCKNKKIKGTVAFCYLEKKGNLAAIYSITDVCMEDIKNEKMFNAMIGLLKEDSHNNKAPMKVEIILVDKNRKKLLEYFAKNDFHLSHDPIKARGTYYPDKAVLKLIYIEAEPKNNAKTIRDGLELMEEEHPMNKITGTKDKESVVYLKNFAKMKPYMLQIGKLAAQCGNAAAVCDMNVAKLVVFIHDKTVQGFVSICEYDKSEWNWVISHWCVGAKFNKDQRVFEILMARVQAEAQKEKIRRVVIKLDTTNEIREKIKTLVYMQFYLMDMEQEKAWEIFNFLGDGDEDEFDNKGVYEEPEHPVAWTKLPGVVMGWEPKYGPADPGGIIKKALAEIPETLSSMVDGETVKLILKGDPLSDTQRRGLFAIKGQCKNTVNYDENKFGKPNYLLFCNFKKIEGFVAFIQTLSKDNVIVDWCVTKEADKNHVLGVLLEKISSESTRGENWYAKKWIVKIPTATEYVKEDIALFASVGFTFSNVIQGSYLKMQWNRGVDFDPIRETTRAISHLPEKSVDLNPGEELVPFTKVDLDPGGKRQLKSLISDSKNKNDSCEKSTCLLFKSKMVIKGFIAYCKYGNNSLVISDWNIDEEFNTDIRVFRLLVGGVLEEVQKGDYNHLRIELLRNPGIKDKIEVLAKFGFEAPKLVDKKLVLKWAGGTGEKARKIIKDAADLIPESVADLKDKEDVSIKIEGDMSKNELRRIRIIDSECDKPSTIHPGDNLSYVLFKANDTLHGFISFCVVGKTRKIRNWCISNKYDDGTRAFRALVDQLIQDSDVGKVDKITVQIFNYKKATEEIGVFARVGFKNPKLTNTYALCMEWIKDGKFKPQNTITEATQLLRTLPVESGKRKDVRKGEGVKFIRWKDVTESDKRDISKLTTKCEIDLWEICPPDSKMEAIINYTRGNEWIGVMELCAPKCVDKYECIGMLLLKHFCVLEPEAATEMLEYLQVVMPTEIMKKTGPGYDKIWVGIDAKKKNRLDLLKVFAAAGFKSPEIVEKSPFGQLETPKLGLTYTQGEPFNSAEVVKKGKTLLKNISESLEREPGIVRTKLDNEDIFTVKANAVSDEIAQEINELRSGCNSGIFSPCEQNETAEITYLKRGGEMKSVVGTCKTEDGRILMVHDFCVDSGETDWRTGRIVLSCVLFRTKKTNTRNASVIIDPKTFNPKALSILAIVGFQTPALVDVTSTGARLPRISVGLTWTSGRRFDIGETIRKSNSMLEQAKTTWAGELDLPHKIDIKMPSGYRGKKLKKQLRMADELRGKIFDPRAKVEIEEHVYDVQEVLEEEMVHKHAPRISLKKHLTMAALRQRCDERGIEWDEYMKKDELVGLCYTADLTRRDKKWNEYMRKDNLQKWNEDVSIQDPPFNQHFIPVGKYQACRNKTYCMRDEKHNRCVRPNHKELFKWFWEKEESDPKKLERIYQDHIKGKTRDQLIEEACDFAVERGKHQAGNLGDIQDICRWVMLVRNRPTKQNRSELRNRVHYLLRKDKIFTHCTESNSPGKRTDVYCTIQAAELTKKTVKAVLTMINKEYYNDQLWTLLKRSMEVSTPKISISNKFKGTGGGQFRYAEALIPDKQGRGGWMKSGEFLINRDYFTTFKKGTMVDGIKAKDSLDALIITLCHLMTHALLLTCPSEQARTRKQRNTENGHHKRFRFLNHQLWGHPLKITNWVDSGAKVLSKQLGEDISE